jgi:hypothetical protein
VRWERHNRALRRECVPQCAHPIGHIEPSDECKAHCGASGSPRAIRIHMNDNIFILYQRKSDHVSSPLCSRL